jgi:DNA repair exonuclease SbcCD nuclease subunit
MPIRSIYHISDIHIRAGDSERSREEEYNTAFENLFELLKTFPSIEDEGLIVVAGDIFHNKSIIGPPGIEIAVQLLQGLATIAPTVVIRGNHDYRQDMPDEKDLITAIMKYNISDRLSYLDDEEPECYEIENIGIGIVPIKKALLANATSGVATTLPPFPPISEFSPHITHKIALFHGSITRAKLQNGYESGDGYPLEWFDEYDLVLLGDIHLQQVNRATKVGFDGSAVGNATRLNTYKTQKGTWAYPGSLIQQDFGESLLGHGLLHWDLEKGQVTEYHIHNAYGIVKLQTDAEQNLNVILQKDTLMPLDNAIKMPWFPNQIHCRVLGKGVKCNALLLDDIRRTLQEHEKVVLSISEMYPPAQNHVFGSKNETVRNHKTESSESEEIGDLASLNNPETWIQYILENCKDEVVQKNNIWATWIQKPDTVLIPKNGIPAALLPGIQTQNDKLYKHVEAFRKEQEQQEREAGIQGTVTLKHIEWSWLFNYGSKNHYNFTEAESALTILNAKNGCGKSNFFEVICYALFGKGFPSRENSNYTTAILNSQIPENENAYTKIIFAINGKDYYIERIFRIHSNQRSIDYKKGSPCIIALPTFEIVFQGAKAVKDWIDNTIGEEKTFLASCMLTQDGDCNFFTMEKGEQKKLIDNVFSLNAVQRLELLLKEACKAHSTVSENLQAYLAGRKERKGVVELSKDVLEEKLEEIEGQLMELEGEIQSAHKKWSHLSPRTFLKDKAEYEAELAGIEVEEGDVPDLERLKSERAVLTSKVNPKAKPSSKPDWPVMREEGLEQSIQQWSAEVYSPQFEGLDNEEERDTSLKSIAACRSALDEKRIWQEGWKRTKGFPFAYKEGNEKILEKAEQELKTFEGNGSKGGRPFTQDYSKDKVAMLKKTLASMKPSVEYQQRISVLENHAQEYPKIESAWKTCLKDLTNYTALIKEYETFPSNPNCSACKAQPWKAAFEDAKEQKVKLTFEKRRLKPLMDQYDNEFSGLDEIQTLLKTERDGLARRVAMEEQIQFLEQGLKERELRETVEVLRQSCQYHREEREWSKKERGVLLQLRVLLRESIEKASEWISWYQWKVKERLLEVEASIEQGEKRQKYRELTGIVAAFEPWAREQRLVEERQELQLAAGRIQEEIQRLEAADGEAVKDALREIDVRQELLKVLSIGFKGYREWLYTKKLGPMLQEDISGLLEHMCEGRPLFLEPEWLGSIDTFSWFLRDGVNRTIIEKASGFQRFITGMAMRIAMSHLGICKVVYENLIIDEGFTACDGENLEKVPAFLKKLLKDKLYKGVMLATHLEDLKTCGDKQVGIERDGVTGMARLHVGTYVLAEPPKEPKVRKSAKNKLDS